MYCTDWSSYLAAPDCVTQALVLNKWANTTALEELLLREVNCTVPWVANNDNICKVRFIIVSHYH